MTKNYPNFRKTLRCAICDRTQAQFALEANISAEHLSRMLNKPHINRPTEATLDKIASAAKNAITLQKLKDALDMDEPKAEKTEEPETLPIGRFEDTAENTMAKLAAFIRDIIHYPCITGSVEDTIENIMKKFQDAYPDLLKVSYDIDDPKPYIGKRTKNAQYYVNVDVSMADYNHSAMSQFLVLYEDAMEYGPAPNGENCHRILKISAEVEDIADLYGLPPAALDKAAGGKEDREDYVEEAFRLPYFLYIVKNTHFREKYCPNAKSMEENLLQSIFGVRTEYPTSIDGTGFWLEKTPETLKTFVGNHMESALRAYECELDTMDQLKKGLTKILADENAGNEDLVKYLDDFDDHGIFDFQSQEDGWQAIISDIMTEETGWRFEFLRHAESKEWKGRSEHDCILIRQENTEHIQREALLNAICAYASELGIGEFGDILFHTMAVTDRKPHTYVVKKKEPEEEIQIEPEDLHEMAKLDEDHKPEKSGLYWVCLKDGRMMRIVYIKSEDKNLWIMHHMEWSHMIDCFDPTPLKLENPKKENEN